MTDTHHDFEVLISGYLDGELSAEDRQKLENQIEASPGLRREFEAMKSLVVGTSAALAAEPPPDEVWDSFLDTIYNRLERRTGWAVLIAGVIALTVYGLILFCTEPWAAALTKLLVAVPLVGLAILFTSVLRQRLIAAKTDRYSKEVHR